ncbi:MAG: LysM peptidoglycan-binding domain-containing protein [Pseudomonadota bacterium]
MKLVKKGVDLKRLAKQLGVSKDVIYGLNPAYKRGIIPKQNLNIVRVPTSVDETRFMAAANKSLTKITSDVIASSDGQMYRIRRGDTLSHISQRFGTSIRSLREANNLGRRSVLYPGKKLIIPSGRRTATRKKESKPVALKEGEKSYTVREGDNLYNISKRFGVSLSKIKKRNGLGRRSLLNIGKVLVIPANL